MKRADPDDAARAAAACFNMTPMIDVCFQLIVVFLCSMKFRTLDQKIEAMLPTHEGIDPCIRDPRVETRVQVRLRRPPGEERTRVLLLDNGMGWAGSPGVWDSVQAALAGFARRDPSVKGEIDADPEVPHEEVMRALDTFIAADLTSVSFRGTPRK